MRKAIILGSILALIGVASVAQASDRLNSGERDSNSVHSETSDGSQTGRHDRIAREDRSRDRHNEFHSPNLTTLRQYGCELSVG